MDEATKGKWLGEANSPGDRSAIGDGLGVYAVHAALLPTGRVIMFSGRVEGSRYLYRSWTWDATTFSEGDTSLSGVIGRWFLSDFDPAGGGEPEPPGDPVPTWDDDNNIDLFCAHHVMLEDGRLLVVGGAGGIREGDAAGNRAIFFYDPEGEKWIKASHLLQRGRWYPTAVNLPDGRVVVVSGRTASGSGQEAVAEVLTPPDMQASVIAGADRRFFIYPGLVMVPGGRIFYLPTNWLIETQNAADATDLLDPTVALEMTGPSAGNWVDFDSDADPAVKVAPNNRWREEGTFVLLPPAQAGRIMMIGGGYAEDALRSTDQRAEADIDHCEILETQGATPRWVEAGRLHFGRVNVHAVLMPDGKVFIVGGHSSVKRNPTHSDRLIAEIYDPKVPYDPADPQAAFTQVAEMDVSRNYHATALLLPDGRILVAGGEDNPHGGGNQTSIEIYEPPYCHQGPRPGIEPIDNLDAPAGEIVYGGSFVIRCETVEQAQEIGEVVLMRPGAPTHHTDTEQRHVPLSFSYTGGTDLVATAVLDPSVAPPGYYMLFVIDALGKPCKQARWVRLSHRRCRLITDRSTFSVEELEAIPSRAVEAAFYVHVEGFLPSELGITDVTSPTATQLDNWSPDISFWEAGTEITDLRARASEILAEDPSLPPSVRQRFTFKYTLHVDDMSVFPAEGARVERRTLELRTDQDGWRCQGRIHLMRQPDPYVLDGPTHWLSTDVRVFKLRAGQSRFGRMLDASDPHAWLRDVLSDFDGDTTLDGHPFTGISEDQAESALQLAETEGGTPVFNFAICRVRYRATTTPASNVRMHFRMFTTAATNLNYNPNTTYRFVSAGGSNIALPGIGAGNEVITIPFYGNDRIDLSAQAFADQRDTLNLKELPAGGTETRRYFGVLLDINLPDSKLPRELIPSATGPFASGDLVPIAELIRGRHQCLVAEVDFNVDPITLNDNPANSDNLAQRNLAIEGSDNPGGVEAHTVALSFDIDPTWSVKWAQKNAGLMNLNETRAPAIREKHGRHAARAEFDEPAAHHERRIDPVLAHLPEHIPAPVFVENAWMLGDRLNTKDAIFAADPIGARFAPAHHEHATPPRFGWLEPDELMIQWGELPSSASATLHIPYLNSDHVMRLLRTRPRPLSVEPIDHNTLSLSVGGVTHIPLPALGRQRLAGLLSITLPPSVRVGQRFNVTLHQVSLLHRVVVGAFELSIPVTTGPELLVEDSRWLAVLRHILLTLSPSNRWYSVLKRLERIVAGRVDGFGGDESMIDPTLNPEDITEPGDKNHPADDCWPKPEGGRVDCYAFGSYDEERVLCELLIKKYLRSCKKKK